MRLDRGQARSADGALHLAVHLRRSRGGRRLIGTVRARCGSAAAGTSRSGFTQEFPLLLSRGEARR
jgi:hypothetical protein